MTEELKVKLREIYDEATLKAFEVIGVFVDYFGEELVDFNILSFDGFIESLKIGKFRSYIPSGTDVITDTVNGIVHFRRGTEEITMTLKEAQDNAGKEFLDAVTEETITFFKPKLVNIIRSMIDLIHIYVKFPEVRVTNENDKFIDIKDLYARITVHGPSGLLVRFIELNRATYTISQYTSDYAHSHLPGIPHGWTEPCYGSGPIISTMDTLRRECDIDIWGLLCYELSKYVTVESLAGVPYRRLENVGADRRGNVNSAINYYESLPVLYGSGVSIDRWREFLTSFLSKNELKFSFYRGRYDIGESPISLWVKLSKAFSEWYSAKFIEGKVTQSFDRLLSSGVINKYVVADGRVYTPQGSSLLEEARNENGRDMFMFKGEMVKLTITDITDNVEPSITYLVNHCVMDYLVTKILEVINYKYGREEKDGEAPTKKKCFYI